MSSLATLVLPPQFLEGSYESFKKEIDIWKLLKTCNDIEQGPIVFRSLTGRAKIAALELSAEDIGSKDGLDKIIKKLDKLYLPESNQRTCAVLEKFENFRRSPTMNMSGFILEFERLRNQLKGYGCTYPDGVLAYRLMKSANMSKEHEQLCRATIATDKWSYSAVLEQIRKIFNDYTAVKPQNDSSSTTDKPVKVETYLTRNDQPQDCYFNSNNYEDCESIQYNNFTGDEECDHTAQLLSNRTL